MERNCVMGADDLCVLSLHYVHLYLIQNECLRKARHDKSSRCIFYEELIYGDRVEKWLPGGLGCRAVIAGKREKVSEVRKTFSILRTWVTRLSLFVKLAEHTTYFTTCKPYLYQNK